MISKYADLEIAYEEDSSKWIGYEKAIIKFMDDFLKELAAFLECPKEAVQLKTWPKDHIPQEHIISWPLRWLDEQAFWHFRISISFSDGGSITTEIKVKRPDYDTFLVQLADEKPVEIKERDFTNLLELTSTSSKKYLESRFRKFIQGEGIDKKRKLGF